MTAPDPDALPLPGLEAPARVVSALEAAVRRTLAALDADGHLSEVHAAATAMALELAQTITAKRASGRASTVANDVRELRELLASLVPDDAGDGDAELRRAMAAWSQELGREATP